MLTDRLMMKEWVREVIIIEKNLVLANEPFAVLSLVGGKYCYLVRPPRSELELEKINWLRSWQPRMSHDFSFSD